MVKILPNYLRRQFFQIFFFCLLSVIILFLVVDIVENLDRFIDRAVPWKIVLLYYLYYIPYIIVLTLPIATLLATIFSVGNFARHNEMVAMKSLGYSLYRVMGTLLGIGLFLSVFSFLLAEGVVTHTNRKKENIRRTYLDRVPGMISSVMRNLEIHVPPDKIVTIGYYDKKRRIARQVKIETFQGHKLISRIDAPSMRWNGKVWVIKKGYQRIFKGEKEKALPLKQPYKYPFQFTPKELLVAQIKPDEMTFTELLHFISEVRNSGGEVHQWMTDLHLRIAFPLSNFIIILFSVPLAYNRRKKSLIVGFGISLLVCFFYFGLVKMGQTMGENGSVPPLLGAWLGNILMGAAGVFDLINTRK